MNSTIKQAIEDEAARLYPYKEATVFNSGEIGIRQRNAVDNDRWKFKSNATYGYSLAEQEIEVLKRDLQLTYEQLKTDKQEITRLKELIEKLWDESFDLSIERSLAWQQFKTNNQL